MRIRYRILSKLGVWATGIYENDECVDWYFRQTFIRRVLNRIWEFLNNHEIGNLGDSDLPDFDYLLEG